MSSDNKQNEESQRRSFSPEQKMKILRQHLLETPPPPSPYKCRSSLFTLLNAMAHIISLITNVRTHFHPAACNLGFATRSPIV